jgi:hypothetical protein
MSRPPLAESEYDTLRATIRERGTMRGYVLLAGITSWGALAITSLIAGVPGGMMLVPLVVLAATFELSFFVHTGVERIGRYIQVFYEESSGWAGWETTAMNYGAKFPGGLDPLFVSVFSIAAAINFFSSLAAATFHPMWIAMSLLMHALFSYRIVSARKAAASQRALDLDRFRTLLSK